MGDDSGVAIALSELNGTEGLGKRANLVNLNKDRVGAAELDTLFKILNVGNEQVVAYELATVADKIGKNLPAFPVAFGHTVLD